MSLWDLPRTEEEAVRLFQSKGIIPTEKYCKNGHPMKLYFGSRIFWKCNRKNCKNQIGLRTGNWLTNSRLSLVTALRFIYPWCWETSSVKWCQRELGIGNNSVIDWNNYMREVCVNSLANLEKTKIGGKGKVVEIDESLFTKRKNNAGRILPQQWVFGGICRETNECFLVKVPNRSAETICAAIVDNIIEGSIIYSDSWRGYHSTKLEDAGFQHLKVNHKYNFVNPHTAVHTQHIKRLWGSAKWRNKRHRGTARQHLESYLAEFMWRSKLPFGCDPFDIILEDISKFMPPQ